jgi:PIN domain nuclease of toxin-antitoxin system
MNLLLDTHTLIWWMADSARLGQLARQSIEAPESKRFISAVSAWEISIKTALGRLKLSEDPAASIAVLMTRGFQPLSIQLQHAWQVGKLPSHHADPFDRMLVAQAQCEGLTLVTADGWVAAYDVPTIDASQ